MKNPLMLVLLLAAINVGQLRASESGIQPTPEKNQGKDEPAKKTAVRLELTETNYDPLKPSKGLLKCFVRNGTAEAITLPHGYHARGLPPGSITLLSGRLTLYRLPRSEREPQPKKMVRIEPGKEELLFELALDNILQRTDDAGKEWRWDWQGRPAPPRSPIHKWRQKGFNEEAKFRALVTIGRDTITSNEVTLKVKATPQPEIDGKTMK